MLRVHHFHFEASQATRQPILCRNLIRSEQLSTRNPPFSGALSQFGKHDKQWLQFSQYLHSSTFIKTIMESYAGSERQVISHQLGPPDMSVSSGGLCLQLIMQGEELSAHMINVSDLKRPRRTSETACTPRHAFRIQMVRQ